MRPDKREMVYIAKGLLHETSREPAYVFHFLSLAVASLVRNYLHWPVSLEGNQSQQLTLPSSLDVWVLTPTCSVSTIRLITARQCGQITRVGNLLVWQRGGLINVFGEVICRRVNSWLCFFPGYALSTFFFFFLMPSTAGYMPTDWARYLLVCVIV